MKVIRLPHSATAALAALPPAGVATLPRAAPGTADLEDPLEVAAGAFDAQPHQAERRPVVEDHDQDRALGHDRDVDMVLLPFVEQDRELALADQLGETVRRGHVARGEGGERSGVELLDLAGCRDLLTVLVDQEDGLAVSLLPQAAQSLLELLELLFVEHEVGCAHDVPFRTARRYTIPHRSVKALISRQLPLV
jgi:hypothetical protein